MNCHLGRLREEKRHQVPQLDSKHVFTLHVVTKTRFVSEMHVLPTSSCDKDEEYITMVNVLLYNFLL